MAMMSSTLSNANVRDALYRKPTVLKFKSSAILLAAAYARTLLPVLKARF
jgi:hypothetical protein